ncbi:MAG TPA: methionine--tRNA ligase [Candidatus Paceibacterota bacterium]|jgi:methionyl-tRNA synthetase|nr:methionine--tRNA ligase [Candidatus Paceibacterota bacterium]
MEKNFYITTTLPYVNAPLHMGHALEFVRADTFARYKKLQGYTVFFNTGTDEHGQKIFNRAVDSGQSPQAFVDGSFESFKKQIASFNISSDVHFVRTTDDHHISAAQEFWKRVNGNGYIYKKTYQSKYCVGCEAEKTDSELDENGHCLLHPTLEIEIIDEENYFFKFSEFQEKLLSFYETKANFVIPDFRFNEMKAFVKGGLQDFSISRVKEKMSWGIPVPGDDTQVMYVWFDALVNYISTLGWPENIDQYEKFWVHGTPTQYCGKDNTRFQSVMWQAMLMAADIPNSERIVVNGFITAEGGVRMSKTLGNVVDPLEIANEYGTDALRFFLLKEISSFEDSPFTIERFKASYQANLANGIGNLTSRIMKMVENYDVNYILPTDEDLLEFDDAVPEDFHTKIDGFDLKAAMDDIWREVNSLDWLIQKEEPFKLAKTDLIGAQRIVGDLAIRLYIIGFLLQPFMPTTAQTILDLVKNKKSPEKPLFARLEQ